jgi:hypothetical protein
MHPIELSAKAVNSGGSTKENPQFCKAAILILVGVSN